MRRARLGGSGWILFWSGWATLALSLGPKWPVRVAAVFVFTAVAPGAAVVRHLHLGDRLEASILAVAISLSLAVVVTELLSLPHWFSASASLAVLAGVTSLLVVVPDGETHVLDTPSGAPEGATK